MADAKKISTYSLFLAFAVPLVVLVAHAFYYYPFFADDAFISLRYSERLIEGKGLNWNDGEYVEGYSNLLWVLATAGLGALGMDLLAAGRAVGMMSAVATMLAFSYFFGKRCSNIPALFMANLGFALTAPVAIWSIGGLEAALVMALMAWAFVFAHDVLESPDYKKARWCGLLLGGVCLSRPEGAIFTVFFALGMLMCATYSRMIVIRPVAVMCFIAFLFFASQLGFRLAYYGDWVANTYYVKVAFTASRLNNGIMYCLLAVASMLPLIVLAPMRLDKKHRDAGYLAAKSSIGFMSVVCVLWITMLVIAGGDIFPGYRHFLYIIPALILMVMQSLDAMYGKGSVRSTHVFIGYVLACFVWLQLQFYENQRAREEGWLWETKELADFMRKEYGEKQPLTAVTLAGIIPYYSKLPSIDMYGLNDGYITKHRDEAHGFGKFGEGFVGHELFNSKYVLSRKPDIIIFHAGNKPPLYGMGDEPEFKANYQSRKIQLPSYTAEIWLRKGSPKAQ
jgi:arabinofuranosyltransferase